MEALSEELPLPIPPALQATLEDDCFWILRRGKLLTLPRQPSVEVLLREYYIHCLVSLNEDINLQLLAEILDGVKIYFDFMLVDHLLYEPEKQQFERAMSAGTCNSHSEPGSKRLAPSDVYGVEHLLRLMVKLPLFLTHTQLPASHIAVINTHLKDFMSFLSLRKLDLFSEDNYEDTNQNPSDPESSML